MYTYICNFALSLSFMINTRIYVKPGALVVMIVEVRYSCPALRILFSKEAGLLF